MPKKPEQFEFKFSSLDHWGNTMVECPVCGFEFKLDGIRKHIIQTKEKLHKAWYRSHKWKTGIGECAIHSKRL